MIVDGHFFIFQDVFMPTRKCVISGEYINNLNRRMQHRLTRLLPEQQTKEYCKWVLDPFDHIETFFIISFL